MNEEYVTSYNNQRSENIKRPPMGFQNSEIRVQLVDVK